MEVWSRWAGRAFLDWPAPRPNPRWLAFARERPALGNSRFRTGVA